MFFFFFFPACEPSRFKKPCGAFFFLRRQPHPIPLWYPHRSLTFSLTLAGSLTRPPPVGRLQKTNRCVGPEGAESPRNAPRWHPNWEVIVWDVGDGRYHRAAAGMHLASAGSGFLLLSAPTRQWPAPAPLRTLQG